MFGTKLEDAFKLKPHLIDGIFQYGNLKGLNDNDSEFFCLGGLRLRPIVRCGGFYLQGSIRDFHIKIVKHSESQLKGQKPVPSYEISVKYITDLDVYNESVVVSKKLLDMQDGEEKTKSRIAFMIAKNAESYAKALMLMEV